MTRRALTAALLLASTQALAHPLGEGTARVTLRDEHLEVLCEWDVFLLIDRSPTEVATASEEALRETHRQLLRAIEQGTRLRVDDAPRALDVTAGPTPDELRAIAATLSASGQTHGERLRVRLEARQPAVHARRVTLEVPRALGPVVVTFVQPETRYLTPGMVGSFEVLVPPPSAGPAPLPTSQAPLPTSHGITVFFGLATLLTSAALLGRLATRTPRLRTGVNA